jgi:peptidoglycan hydrolase-like protein with peptidoglycan-binding domain
LIPDLSNLAAVTESLGESPEAIRLRIVAIQKKAVRQESLQLVSYHNDLATFYTARGNYAKAEFRLNEKLTLERNLFAPDDPRIVATVNSLVTVLRYEQKDAEADVLVKQLQGIQGGATLLQKGTYGPEVKKLKLRLQDLGFFHGDLDENFGPATERAVIEFQKSQGLVADGIAGERTLTLLEKPGTKQVGTIEIQTELKKLGFYSGAVDGSFGMMTKASLMAFQRSKGLAADGTANPETLEALGLKTPARASSVTGQVTVEIVAQMFPGTPIDTIKANLPSFLKALVFCGWPMKTIHIRSGRSKHWNGLELPVRS